MRLLHQHIKHHKQATHPYPHPPPSRQPPSSTSTSASPKPLPSQPTSHPPFKYLFSTSLHFFVCLLVCKSSPSLPPSTTLHAVHGNKNVKSVSGNVTCNHRFNAIVEKLPLVGGPPLGFWYLIMSVEKKVYHCLG